MLEPLPAGTCSSAPIRLRQRRGYPWHEFGDVHLILSWRRPAARPATRFAPGEPVLHDTSRVDRRLRHGGGHELAGGAVGHGDARTRGQRLRRNGGGCRRPRGRRASPERARRRGADDPLHGGRRSGVRRRRAGSGAGGGGDRGTFEIWASISCRAPACSAPACRRRSDRCCSCWSGSGRCRSARCSSRPSRTPKRASPCCLRSRRRSAPWPARWHGTGRRRPRSGSAAACPDPVAASRTGPSVPPSAD